MTGNTILQLIVIQTTGRRFVPAIINALRMLVMCMRALSATGLARTSGGTMSFSGSVVSSNFLPLIEIARDEPSQKGTAGANSNNDIEFSLVGFCNRMDKPAKEHHQSK